MIRVSRRATGANEPYNRELSATEKIVNSAHWLPGYALQRLSAFLKSSRPQHLIIALADHFEPSIDPASGDATAHFDDQERRLVRWCREYPRVADRYRDDEGRPFVHTYFYPAEQAHVPLIDRLAEHCHAGWGEIEIHLHHGRPLPDTADNTRRVLIEFRDMLAARGCLSRWQGIGTPRYAFVHGNWALANSAGGEFCGVDNEMQILAETGCYADLTLPSAPNAAQVAKINALYECALPLDERAPHRRGIDLRVGRMPRQPVIIQGPLGLSFSRPGWRRIVPHFENAAVSGNFPATVTRLRSWEQAGIGVKGREEWCFIKLHCHGMDPRDESAMLGGSFEAFLRECRSYATAAGTGLHYVTAREMMNIALAACDGREGDPGVYRDYRLLYNRASSAARPEDHRAEGMCPSPK